MEKLVDRVDGYEIPALPVTDPAKDILVQAAADASGRARYANLDGFVNELTGIGTVERDKTLGGKDGSLDFKVRLLSGSQCMDRWRGSDLGGAVVEKVPEEMTREGWELTVQPEDDAELRGDVRARADAIGRLVGRPRRDAERIEDEGQALAESIEAELRRLGAAATIRSALCYERAYGGGAILVGVDDGGEDLATPLDLDKVRRVTHLTAFRGGWDGELVAWTWYSDLTGPKFGQPEVYMLRNLGVPITTLPVHNQQVPQVKDPYMIRFVHESRLILFNGPSPAHLTRVQMRGWGDSVFTRVDEVLSQFGQTWGGVSNLMTDWAQGVLKIEGLAELLSAQNGSMTGAVATRMMAINLSKSIARTMLIDSKEDFKREVTPLSGIAEVLQQFALRLSAAAGMPVSLLMGQAPAGLNATGASDVRFFYDRVRGLQRDGVIPALEKLIRLLFRATAGPTGGREPVRWHVDMRPLWQLTALEEADLRVKQKDVDVGYIQTGVVDPGEVAASRFGGARWSAETVIDLDARREAAVMREPDPEAGATNEPETTEKSGAGASLTVNEARMVLGLGRMLTMTGDPDPDGLLTIAEFSAKHASVVAAGTAAQEGEDAQRADHVEKRGSRWVLLSRKTGQVLGTHRTRGEAEAQERAIQAAKHAR